MRITAVRCQNFKRIHDIEIRPDADRTLILIGGKNANGKSSLLDALSTAFGGKRQAPADPVRHGADEATIRVELDGGELEVRRVISPDGESVLEVRDRLGAIKAPQATLDKLVGARFLDPLAFLNLPAKEQRAQLMRLIPDAERIATLNDKRARAFDRRTEIGRDLTKAEGELARLPEVTVEAPIDVAALHQEEQTFVERQRADRELVLKLEQSQRDTAAARMHVAAQRRNMDQTVAEIERLKAELARQEAEAAEWARDVAGGEEHEAKLHTEIDAAKKAWDDSLPRRQQIHEAVCNAGDHNRTVFAAEAQNRRRAEVAAEVEKLGAERETLTKLLDTIDARKAEILAAAKLPVDGLAIADHGIELAGVPFVQASDAEKWRVALALAIAAAPGLEDVWIRDGALLDEDSLARVAEHAAAAGKRVWIERVGTSDPGVIEIRDGRIADTPRTKEVPMRK